MSSASAAITLNAGALRLGDLVHFARNPRLEVDVACERRFADGQRLVAAQVRRGRHIYGVNTGFGKLADTVIPLEQLSELQHRLVLSTAAGYGALLPDATVRLCLLLKVNALAQGYSGVRAEVVQALLQLLNRNACPCVPAKGSVGASGDLAPLAHLVAPIIGHGEVRLDGKVMPAAAALAALGMQPLRLEAKEGLALVNGTQVSTALAIEGLLAIEKVFAAALTAGALTTEAVRGSLAAFDARIHAVRRQPGQIDVAAALRRIFSGCRRIQGPRVQDPYSVRCQPQVMGACLDMIRFAAGVIEREISAVTDNPLVFAEDGDMLSGGNFHAEPIAMAADMLAIAVAEVGALSERRIALLVDQHSSRLPPFLVAESGLNTGFMVPQVTAAALASENKSLAHPASVDSLPTSANQEDHVSMATFAARRLRDMAENTRGIVAIELLAAAQGVELNGAGIEAPGLLWVQEVIRGRVPSLVHDRYFATDLRLAADLVDEDFFRDFCGKGLLPSMSAS
ncbi:MAG: histidine ammonia-lyase [Proteobacteria bacterium]|nr:histidine ammonia-lyase [Pseudomonadota bacterium]